MDKLIDTLKRHEGVKSRAYQDQFGTWHIGAGRNIHPEGANQGVGLSEEEIDFMINLCEEHEIGTLLTVNRTLEDDGIHEKFRHLPKNDACSNQQIWVTVADD